MKEKYLESALQIGNRILREAFWKDDFCTWAGYINSMKLNQTTYGFVSGDLYNGTSGISFFLTQLYQITQDKLYKKASIAGLNFSIKNLEIYNYSGRESLFAGLGGIAYSFYHAYKVFGEEELLQKTKKIIEHLIKTKNDYDFGNDIINGPPGFLIFLLKIKDEIQIENLDEYIEKLIQKIINSAEESAEGTSWKTVDNVQKNLTGYAHGSAGFALALAEAYLIFKVEKYKKIALDACKYENHYFQQQQNNWPDFRTSEHSCMTAWCHGSPGIGASRARMYEIFNVDFLKTDTQNAAKSLIENDQNVLKNHAPQFSYCHGIFGNADLLIYMNKFLKNPKANEHITQVADYGHERFTKFGLEFPSGIISGKYNPSLMLGEAGIGLFYLRFINTEIATPLLII